MSNCGTSVNYPNNLETFHVNHVIHSRRQVKRFLLNESLFRYLCTVRTAEKRFANTQIHETIDKKTRLLY